MKEKAIVVLCALGLTACVKVNIVPEDAVKNTFRAGQTMYDESKLKRQGGKKRELANQVALSDFSSRAEAEEHCFQTLSTKLAEDSIKKSPIVTSERVVIVDGLQGNVIECQTVGFVWR